MSSGVAGFGEYNCSDDALVVEDRVRRTVFVVDTVFGRVIDLLCRLPVSIELVLCFFKIPGRERFFTGIS